MGCLPRVSAGVRTVEIDGRRVTYASDAEMAAAITDLDAASRLQTAMVGGDESSRPLRRHCECSLR
jgi:hypothetical protein